MEAVTRTSVLLCAAFGGLWDKAQAEETGLPIALNASVVSSYIDRGVDVSDGKAAIQGGVDWAHGSGAYLGTWASSYSYRDDEDKRRDDYQLDLYAGYRWEVSDDVTIDTAVTRIFFGDLENNTELEVGLVIRGFSPRLYYDLDFETVYAELVYEHDLSDRLSLIARGGYYIDSGDLFDELDLEDEAEILLEGEDPYDFGVELSYAINAFFSVFGVASYQEAEEEEFAIGFMVEI